MRATPGLAVRLFDLPAVTARATARFAAEGLSHRAETQGGNFRTAPLPTGADVISLVRVVHDHDDDTVRLLLRAAYEALGDGGTLLIAEPMAGTAGAEPVTDAYFGFYLLAMGKRPLPPPRRADRAPPGGRISRVPRDPDTAPAPDPPAGVQTN